MPIGAPRAAAAAELTAKRAAATHRKHPTRHYHPCSIHVQSVSQDSLAAAAAAPTPAAAAGGGPQDLYPEAWEQCVVHLQSMGFAEADAETYVQRAFGWGAKARSYWRHEKVRTSLLTWGGAGARLRRFCGSFRDEGAAHLGRCGHLKIDHPLRTDAD
jgi:hypothetical protein